MEILLPNPKLKGEKSIEECIYNRESVRNYKDKEIEIKILNFITKSYLKFLKNKRTSFFFVSAFLDFI